MGVARFAVSEVNNIQALTDSGANYSAMGISAVKVQEPEMAEPAQAVSLQKSSPAVTTTPGGP